MTLSICRNICFFCSFKDADHMISHHNSSKNLVTHFFAKEVNYDDYCDIERNTLNAKEWGIEVCMLFCVIFSTFNKNSEFKNISLPKVINIERNTLNAKEWGIEVYMLFCVIFNTFYWNSEFKNIYLSKRWIMTITVI